jgi:hypothetical protein
MYLAMLLHYLNTGESLMLTDFMRLNDIGADGGPLGVGLAEGDLYLIRSRRGAIPVAGLGASLELSS